MHKKILKYIVIFLLGLVLLALVLLTFLNSEWGRSSIVGITNKYSPIRIELNGLKLNLVKGEVLLEDLSIYDKENIKMAGIRQLFVDVRLRPIFSGNYDIDSLIIVGLYGDITSDQIKSLMRKDQKKDSKPLNLTVKNLKVINTDIKYKDIARSAEYGFKNNMITASVNIQQADYSFKLEGSEIKINSPKVNKTVLNDSLIVSLRNSKLEVKPANFKTEGLDLSFGGNVSDLFSMPDFDINMSAEIENSRFFNKSEIFASDSGIFSVEAVIRGNPDNPEFGVSLKHPSGIVYGQKISSFDLKANYKDKLLKLESKLLKAKDGIIDIYGNIDLSAVFAKGIISSEPEFDKIIYEIMINSDNFSLKNIPDMPDTKLDINLDIEGKGIKPEDITASISINTKLSPFSFKEFHMKKPADLKADIKWENGKLDSKINLSAGSLEWKDHKLSAIDLICSTTEAGYVEIKKCDLRLDSSKISLTGNTTLFDKEWHLLKDPKINILLAGNNIHTKELYSALDTKLNFNVNAKGRLNSLSGNFDLKTTEIKYSGIEIENVLVKGKFAGRDIILESLDIACGGGNINAEGKITGLKTFESRIKTEKVKIGLLYPKISETFKSEVNFDIKAEGDFKNPVVKGDIEFKEIFAGKKRLKDMKINMSLTDLLAELKLDLGFDVNAKLNFKDSNYSFRADFKKWDYSYLIPDSMNRKLNGFINGYVEGKGNLEQLQGYNFKADLDSIVLKMKDKNMISGNKFKAEFTKGILKIDKFRLELLSEGFIQAEGDMDAGENLNFSIQTDLPIQSMGAFHPEFYDSEGFIKGDFEIKGIMTEPELKGKINLEKMTFNIPVTLQKVYDLNSEIIIDPAKIEIKSFAGRIKKGKFNLEGSINLSHNQILSSNLNFSSVALPVIYQDYFEGILTSDLNYSGNLSKGRLRGDLVLMEGLYYQDFDPFGKVFKDKGTKILKSAAKNDSLPDVSLNLTLKSRHPIVIDNSSAFIELNPDIEIKGTLSDPLITGRTTMEKGGFIVFQKNTFSITRGVLDFAPVHGMLPTVDVKSEATVSDFTVFLSISGNLGDPRFSLSSVPQKSQADILTILLLGKNVNEFLKGNETAVSGTKEKFLANWIYNTFQQDIARNFGLDYLEFSVSDGFSADDISGTGLTIGKNISDRLILKYSASNDASKFIQKGIADYQFFENIIFSGFQTTEGRFGAEIKYKLEFR